jgi:hypothetical protein
LPQALNILDSIETTEGKSKVMVLPRLYLIEMVKSLSLEVEHYSLGFVRYQGLKSLRRLLHKI